MALRETFKSILGRDPTEDENKFFQKFISDGQLQEYEIGQILGATPEAQQKLLDTQSGQYEQRLAQGDERMLGQAGDQITQRLLQQGRSATGSGYMGAYFSAARDLASARQNKLADFYGGGLQGVQQNYLSQGQGAQQRGYGLRDETRQREYALADYYRQQNDFNNYLKGQSTRNLQSGLMNAGIGLGVGALGGFGKGFMSGLGGS